MGFMLSLTLEKVRLVLFCPHQFLLVTLTYIVGWRQMVPISLILTSGTLALSFLLNQGYLKELL